MTQFSLDLDLPSFTHPVAPGAPVAKERQMAAQHQFKTFRGASRHAWNLLVKEANFDWTTGYSDVWVMPQSLRDTNFGNGNKLFRRGSVVARHFVLRFVYANGIERVTHPEGAKHYRNGVETQARGDTTIAIRVEGYLPLDNTNKPPVPASVRDHFAKQDRLFYVVNGSTTNIDMDHKQGRSYNGVWLDGNNPNLFQPLTDHNNKVKKSACEKCVATGCRFDAQKLGFCVSVLEGTLDFTLPLGCNGCYWHDVKRFHQEHHRHQDPISS